MPIPRIFHRIWLGESPLPAQYEHYGQTWMEHHPDWEHRLWTESEVAELETLRQESRDPRRHPAERSDLLRYEILFRFGGVYIDTDMECLKSIEPLLEGVDLFAGKVRGERLNNAVMGCTAGHRVAKRLVSKARPLDMESPSGRKVDQRGTGPYFLTAILDEATRKGEAVTLFEPPVFYPRPRGPYDDAYAVHHQGRSWYLSPQERELTDLKERHAKLQARLEKTEQRLAATQKRLDKTNAQLSGTHPWRVSAERLRRRAEDEIAEAPSLGEIRQAIQRRRAALPPLADVLRRIRRTP